MKSLRLFDRRAGYSLASLGLLLGMIAPGLIPAFASAGVLTTRSMAMSTSTAGATANYKLTFTPTTNVGATGGLVVDFCSDTPLITSTCTAPTGMDASSATASAGSLTKTTNSLTLVTSLTGGTQFTVTFSGIKNPDAGTFYARVMTYDGTTDPISNHTSTTSQGAYSDGGSIALSTTNQIGVTAYVLESMTFCVSGQDIAKNCGDGITAPAAGSVIDPSMTLGQTIGTQKALDAQHVSTGDAYAQLSTNASGGAIVSLKSDAAGCGGLYLNAPGGACNIPAQNTVSPGTVSIGTAGFGLEVSDATDASDASGDELTGTLVRSGSYTSDHYFMDYDSDGDDASGVTGPYGSALFNSDGAAVSNKNVQLTFGASINPNTPAGKYAANLSLIATGTF